MTFGFFLIPIRFVMMFTIISTSVLLSHTTTMFRSMEQIQTEPMSSWRKYIKIFIARCMMRSFYFFAGFQWITVRGTQATSSQAPILVVAPHSPFFDSMLAMVVDCPSFVARAETRDEWFNGQLMIMMQAIFVSRLNRDSRGNAIQLIAERAQKIVNNPEHWPQLMMFPEGTTGNRSCLVTFKQGAFIPGLPVQPILITYPNKFDSTTWTFDGAGFWTVLFRAMMQFHNSCTIEFLDVYVPSEEEKQDPVLYANNVEKVMSKALGIPTSDYVYEDGIGIRQFPKDKIVARLTGVARFRKDMLVSNLTDVSLMKKLALNGLHAQVHNSEANFLKELSILVNKDSLATASRLFELFDKHDKMIDKREYLVYASLLNPFLAVSSLLTPVFILYTQSSKLMNLDQFTTFMAGNFGISAEVALEIFTKNPTISPDDKIDVEAFSKKMKKRLSYIKLLGLETIGLLNEYPPKATN